MHFTQLNFTLIIRLAIISCLFLPAFASAICVDLESSDIWVSTFCSPHQTYDPMGFRGIVAQNDHLYLLQISVGLVIVDISDPAEPTYSSRLPANVGSYGAYSGLAVRDGIACLALDDLMIASVTDPFAPDTLSIIPTRDSPRDVAIHNQALLVADSSAGVSSYDLSNPEIPVLRDSLALDGVATRIVSCNGRILVATQSPNVLHLIEASVPFELDLISSVELPGYINDLCYDDGKVLATTSNGAVLFRMAPSGEMAPIRNFPEGRGAAFLKNEEAWMANSSSWHSALQRYDLVPTGPHGELISETWFMGMPWRIVEHRGVVWLAELGDWWAGTLEPCCHALDPESGPTPEPEATLFLPYGPQNYSGHEVIARIGDLLFSASSGSSLMAVDVSNLSQIQLVETWYQPHLMEVLPSTGDVLITHHNRFSSIDRDWLQFWRVHQEDEVTLELLGEVDLPMWAGFCGLGNNLMAFQNNSGLVLVDVSDPSAAYVYGPYLQWTAAAEASLSGTFIQFIWNDHAVLVDVSDPALPTQVGQFFYDPAYPMSCVLEGSLGAVGLNLSQDGGHIHILDWSNPNVPLLRSSVESDGYRLKLQQGLLFYSGPLHTQAFDLGNPDFPVYLGRFPGGFYRIRRDGGWLFGLDGRNSNALTIYPVPCGAVSSVERPENHYLAGLGKTLLNIAPNPANPRTVIHFILAKREFVTLKIFNQRGQLIRNLFSDIMDQGPQKIAWDGDDNGHRSVASGVYFVRLQTTGGSTSEKVVLVR